MIAEPQGGGFVASLMPTLAALRTMVRPALALRPRLLGTGLTRRPGRLGQVLGARFSARFGTRLGRQPGLTMLARFTCLARLPCLTAGAAGLVRAAATAATTTASTAATVRLFESRNLHARHFDAGNGGADQLLDRLDEIALGGDARVKEWPTLPARPVRPMRCT